MSWCARVYHLELLEEAAGRRGEKRGKIDEKMNGAKAKGEEEQENSKTSSQSSSTFTFRKNRIQTPLFFYW
jgi:hypothetical protein